MQDLKLANDKFLNIFEGTKRITVRLGYRNIVNGSLAFESTTGSWGVIVNVIDVKHKNASELTTEEAKADNFESPEKLIESLKKYYPTIDNNSEITVVSFDFHDALDLPELEAAFLT